MISPSEAGIAEKYAKPLTMRKSSVSNNRPYRRAPFEAVADARGEELGVVTEDRPVEMDRVEHPRTRARGRERRRVELRHSSADHLWYWSTIKVWQYQVEPLPAPAASTRSRRTLSAIVAAANAMLIAGKLPPSRRQQPKHASRGRPPTGTSPTTSP